MFRRRIPICRKFVPPKEANLSGTRMQNLRFIKRGNAESLRRCQYFGFSVESFVEGMLLEPSQCPSGIRIELPLLLGKNFVESLVYEAQSGTHPHWRAVTFKHSFKARKSGHAWTDGSLGEIDRSDVAFLEITHCRRQLLLKQRQKIFSGCNRCSVRPGT